MKEFRVSFASSGRGLSKSEEFEQNDDRGQKLHLVTQTGLRNENSRFSVPTCTAWRGGDTSYAVAREIR